MGKNEKKGKMNVEKNIEKIRKEHTDDFHVCVREIAAGGFVLVAFALDIAHTQQMLKGFRLGKKSFAVQKVSDEAGVKEVHQCCNKKCRHEAKRLSWNSGKPHGTKCAH